jgi:hypothetical protein
VLFHTPFFNPNEGGLNLLTVDDARPVAAWSHYHAAYAQGELEIAEWRERAVRWALDDVRARGLAGQVEIYEAQLASLAERRALLTAQWERLLAARPGNGDTLRQDRIG